jgi:hypothetical protein
MKKENPKNEIVAQERDCGLANVSEGPGYVAKNFARQLRALGQAVENCSFSAFDLKLRSGNYVVNGRANPIHNVKFSFSRFVRELLRGSSNPPSLTSKKGQVELRFSSEDIERFDLRGKSQRQDSSKMPDPYSVSQILRGAGAFLDHRSVANLVGISLSGNLVTVSYQTGEGRLEQAQQDLEYFYNYWVKMYLHRSNRTKLPAPSEPTVLVTWQGIQNA